MPGHSPAPDTNLPEIHVHLGVLVPSFLRLRFWSPHLLPQTHPELCSESAQPCCARLGDVLAFLALATGRGHHAVPLLTSLLMSPHLLCLKSGSQTGLLLTIFESKRRVVLVSCFVLFYVNKKWKQTTLMRQSLEMRLPCKI